MGGQERRGVVNAYDGKLRKGPLREFNAKW
jgi:hypothetical protein